LRGPEAAGGRPFRYSEASSLPCGLPAMLFIVIGVALIVCNFAGWGPMANWQWDSAADVLKFGAPFILALLWWLFSDRSGMTKRRAMQRDAQRKQDRRDRNIDAMGLGHLHRHRDGSTGSKPR
jgi:small Trp-rich protein